MNNNTFIIASRAYFQEIEPNKLELDSCVRGGGDQWNLLVCSSSSSTSDVRPFPKPAVAAVPVDIEASGKVPATVLDDGKFGFSLDGGEREELDCNLSSFSKVLSAYFKDPYVISLFLGFSIKQMYTRCMI